MLDLKPIKALLAEAAPGPWRWFGFVKHDQVGSSHRAYLATAHSGQIHILSGRDLMMRHGEGAGLSVATEPHMMEHREHNGAITGPATPDTKLIQEAPTVIAALLAEVESLRELAADVVSAANVERLHRRPLPEPLGERIAKLADAVGWRALAHDV